jgi:uncharacterized protein YoxC
MRFDTRTILIALVILNVVAIGMSEVQRRALIEQSQSAETEFRKEASDWTKQANAWSKQQFEVLSRTSALFADVDARVNRIEIATSASPNFGKQLAEITASINKIESQTAPSGDASKSLQDIDARLVQMEASLQALSQAKPAQ